ncbi:hypothetical protein F4679DRAFT_203106 [Xylaria curta]|nr:hypothetical protein F4679DRAFT_203106 [Xylaria curta]
MEEEDGLLWVGVRQGMNLPTDLDYPSRTNQMAAPSTYTLHATTSQLPHYLRSTPDALFFFTVIYSACCHVFGRVDFLVRLMQPKARSSKTLYTIYDTYHIQHGPIPSVTHTIPSPASFNCISLVSSTFTFPTLSYRPICHIPFNLNLVPSSHRFVMASVSHLLLSRQYLI